MIGRLARRIAAALGRAAAAGGSFGQAGPNRAARRGNRARGRWPK